MPEPLIVPVLITYPKAAIDLLVDGRDNLALPDTSAYKSTFMPTNPQSFISHSFI